MNKLIGLEELFNATALFKVETRTKGIEKIVDEAKETVINLNAKFCDFEDVIAKSYSVRKSMI